ncbi:hypothetical protein SAMN06295967_101144 [Belliella buryatensis]|uniref:Cellobiose phosphorylase n=1 Tax=Belliella buryatensis TaxID=1500549 RepID=A0A239AGU5_9BACT|nr:hypothetical protein [Belliella buryatensis]SNR94867.1 hypothetical protein SAMN06295967_101144 [Belliella buryatensis]
MNQDYLKIANQQLHFQSEEVSGSFVKKGESLFYKVSHVDQMPPFFMSIVSHDEHWMFIGSNGALTAGKKNEEQLLFPYYTDDKILSSVEKVGSSTTIRIHTDNGRKLWKPFSETYKGIYEIERNLYKSQWGNELIFEEINHDLGLIFSYSWQFSSKYGFVKKSSLCNLSEHQANVEVLDGVLDLMPFGVSSQLQLQRSNLVNAYKRSELDIKTGLGVFALSSQIVDRAEPSEALKATLAWHSGVEVKHVLLSSSQLANFCKGGELRTESDVKGAPASYLINFDQNLHGEQQIEWSICMDIHQTPAQINNLISQLDKNKKSVLSDLKADLKQGTNILKSLVGKADGLQLTADQAGINRHYSNVLFNLMRGGIFEEDYQIDRKDFLEYVKTINHDVFDQFQDFFEGITAYESYQSLNQKALKEGYSDLIRICKEYLPLSFSRRHGDPSRPWNKFSIDLKNPDGSKRRAYAGNWRDIFQNWEALAVSYPKFVEGMVFKFLNASTIDGYNPYRISRNGVDWEVIEPEDPWSYIGYWGDHQLIYLLKLLELGKKHQAISLRNLANQDWFVFANVPYRIRSFEAIVRDPQDTVDFEEQLEKQIQSRVHVLGADGKLTFKNDQQILKSNFLEKLIIPWLTKLGNFIPDAGIWMNTQRPEWNDANNALVGNGTSMVTLYYMYRFTDFLENWLKDELSEAIKLHKEVSDWMQSLLDALIKNKTHLDQGFSNTARFEFVQKLGLLSEAYRNKAYAGFAGEKTSIEISQFLDLLTLTKQYLEKSIQNNKRSDGLYHAYNIINIEEKEITIDHLYEMLEGQVAVLTSGYLKPEECLAVLDQMKSSKLYRADQYSYLLYPNRELKGFLNKSKIPQSALDEIPLLKEMIKVGDHRIIHQDDQGQLYFNSEFNNAKALKNSLEEFKETDDLDRLEALYEQVFNHKSFTGRSGTFFAFEGLGSIYWHMVSKLLYAVGELLSENQEIDEKVRGRLIDHYYEIRAGIGINKSPEVYGAIPTDPYSHTPSHRGAQQPGMTGQVKEDILNRWFELGVQVIDGCITFNPTFLSANEWLTENQDFEYVNLQGKQSKIGVEKEALAFTYCQVPIIYKKDSNVKIDVIYSDSDENESIQGHVLSQKLSEMIFSRSHDIERIEVSIRYN